jgi:hypothetical protein
MTIAAYTHARLSRVPLPITGLLPAVLTNAFTIEGPPAELAVNRGGSYLILRKLTCDIPALRETIRFHIQEPLFLAHISQGLLPFTLVLISPCLFFAEFRDELLAILPQQLTFFGREPASINEAKDRLRRPARLRRPKFSPITVLPPALYAIICPHNDVDTLIYDMSTSLALTLYSVLERDFYYCSQLPQG